jgi:hypothetical protein
VRAVSYFRLGFLKRRVPPAFLASLDALVQPTGRLLTLSPSVFVRAQATPDGPTAPAGAFFRCPVCGSTTLADHGDHLLCQQCGRRWRFQDGIYNFKEPI